MPLKKLRDRSPSVSVGENRKQAVVRLVYGIGYALFILTIGWILGLLWAVYTVFDILFQAITNKDGLHGDEFGGELFERQNRLREYITFGKGSRDSWRR